VWSTAQLPRGVAPLAGTGAERAQRRILLLIELSPRWTQSQHTLVAAATLYTVEQARQRDTASA
jgi:hypothetical protein